MDSEAVGHGSEAVASGEWLGGSGAVARRRWGMAWRRWRVARRPSFRFPGHACVTCELREPDVSSNVS